MSSILKQYLQASLESISEEEVREPSVEEMLELSIESFQHTSEALDNALNLAVTLEGLVDQFEAQSEHDEVSLEQFGDRVGLVLKTAGIELPVVAMVPSLEEANTPADGGASRAAKAKEILQKIWEWIKEKFDQLVTKLKDSGVWIAAQAEAGRQTAKDLSAKATAKLPNLTFKGSSPKTKASVVEVVATYKRVQDAKNKLDGLTLQYISEQKEVDDVIHKAAEEYGEAVKALLAIGSVDTTEGVDAESLKAAKAAVEETADAMDGLKVAGIKASNVVSKSRKLLETSLKQTERTLQGAGVDEAEIKEMREYMEAAIRLTNELTSKNAKAMSDGVRCVKHTMKLMSKVISDAK